MSRPAATWKVEERFPGRFYVIRSVNNQFRVIAGPFATREKANESMKGLKRGYRP